MTPRSRRIGRGIRQRCEEILLAEPKRGRNLSFQGHHRARAHRLRTPGTAVATVKGALRNRTCPAPHEEKPGATDRTLWNGLAAGRPAVPHVSTACHRPSLARGARSTVSCTGVGTCGAPEPVRAASGGGGRGLSARALRARPTAHLLRFPAAERPTQCSAPRLRAAPPLGRRCAVAAPAGSRRSAPAPEARHAAIATGPAPYPLAPAPHPQRSCIALSFPRPLDTMKLFGYTAK